MASTKSPIPNAFAYFLASFCAIVGIIVVVPIVNSRAEQRVVAAVGVAILLLMLVVIVYAVLGIVAGIRYKQERRLLNWIGVGGNGLLLLVCLGIMAVAIWGVVNPSPSRRLGGPIKVAEQYK